MPNGGDAARHPHSLPEMTFITSATTVINSLCSYHTEVGLATR